MLGCHFDHHISQLMNTYWEVKPNLTSIIEKNQYQKYLIYLVRYDYYNEDHDFTMVEMCLQMIFRCAKF